MRNHEFIEEPLIGVGELARLLGVSRKWVYQLLREGKLPQPFVVGSRKKWDINEVREWLQQQRVPKEG